MFAPERMRHLLVVGLRSDLDTIIDVVVRAGALHPLDIQHVAPPPSPIQPCDAGATLARLDALRTTLTALEHSLGIDAPATEPVTPTIVSLDLDATEGRLRQLCERADALNGRSAALAERLAQLQGLARTVRALEPLGVPFDHPRSLRYAMLTSGFVPARNLPRLRDSLVQTPHAILVGSRPGADGRVLATALCRRRDAAVFERALRSAQFEVLPWPTLLHGTPEAAGAELERDIATVRSDAVAVDAERARDRRALGPELATLRASLQWDRLLVEARRRVGHTERLAVLNGWVPSRYTAALERAVEQRTNGRCHVASRAPDDVDGVRRGHIQVPVLLRNPRCLRPFEALLRNYGLPRYDEIEPTPIVALGFLAMFGFMFGDVGQGLVLAALGLLLHRRAIAPPDYAVLLVECGTVVTAFGFLYGSVFGSEHWLPALWLRPLQHTERLMVSAVAFGIGFLTLGMSLNVLNAVRQRDWAALWERNGVLAAWAYWAAVGLAACVYTHGPAAVTVGTALACLGPPLGLILCKEPLRAARAARRAGRRLSPSDVFALVVESLVEVLDTVVSTLSNTATFIRLAAFALSHAGLFLAVFSVADAVARSGRPAGTIAAAGVLVLGNVVIIALEGLIVAIQSVRLEYYEFFSRFYRGEGLEYRPLHHGATAPGRP